MDFRFVCKNSEVMDFMQGTDVVFHAAGVLDRRVRSFFLYLSSGELVARLGVITTRYYLRGGAAAINLKV